MEKRGILEIRWGSEKEQSDVWVPCLSAQSAEKPMKQRSKESKWLACGKSQRRNYKDEEEMSSLGERREKRHIMRKRRLSSANASGLVHWMKYRTLHSYFQAVTHVTQMKCSCGR